MKLSHDFPQNVRELFRDEHDCWLCGSNGNKKGGLSIHHIMGRVIYGESAYNASLLCGKCHEGMCHNEEEERKLFAIAGPFIFRNLEYQVTITDLEFLKKYYTRLALDSVFKKALV